MTLHDNMQFVGYGLMIFAYLLVLYEKIGLSVTFLVVSALSILSFQSNKTPGIIALVIVAMSITITFFIKKSNRKRTNSISQSIADNIQGETITVEDNTQTAAASRSEDSIISQSISRGSKAKGKVTIKNNKQSVD